MAHSILPPSDSYRWLNCPGSVAMQLMHPETGETDEARKGTKEHAEATSKIEKCKNARIDTTGLDPNDPIDIYILNVIATARKHGVFNDEYFQLEKRVEIPQIHKNCYGTPDAWIYVKKINLLIVWDYKTGYKQVEARGNTQLICYASGIISKLKLTKEQLCDLRVELRVIQPNGYHPVGPRRMWVASYQDLVPWISQLALAAESALSAAAKTKAGTWCYCCSARHACPALSLECQKVAEYVMGVEPAVIGGEALSRELEWLDRSEKLIKERKAALEELATHNILNGKLVPGWAVRQKVGNLNWKDNTSAEVMLSIADRSKIDIKKPVKDCLITPTQATKKGLDRQLVEKFARRSVTKSKLQRDPSTRVFTALKREGEKSDR